MLIARTREQEITERGDPELVAMALAGERQAFRVIVQRYNRRLYRVARGIVRDDAEAEDVLQEAWLRAFAALGRFRGDSGLATWLTRIVINEAIGRLRKRHPVEELGVLDTAARNGDAHVIMFPGVSAAPDPESAAARAEIRRLLEGAVDELPSGFRLVFVMRDVEGMSIEETAAALGIEPDTVKTRLHRARKRLRQSLAQELAQTLEGTFPFAGERCQRMTEKVLARLGPQSDPSRE